MFHCKKNELTLPEVKTWGRGEFGESQDNFRPRNGGLYSLKTESEKIGDNPRDILSFSDNIDTKI